MTNYEFYDEKLEMGIIFQTRCLCQTMLLRQSMSMVKNCNASNQGLLKHMVFSHVTEIWNLLHAFINIIDKQNASDDVPCTH